MRSRDEETTQHVEAVLDELRKATEQLNEASDTYWQSCLAWENAVRQAYQQAKRLSPKELAPTVVEMADVLGVSTKTLQLIRQRPHDTAVWPRPTTRN